ncbi:MAG: hypothetical protein J6B89_00310 [Bacilli bacterium]|nr:hypothetical protein [Bacilli bacterium]
MSVELINPFSNEDMSKIEQYDQNNQTDLKRTIESQYSSMNEVTYKKSIIESYIVALYLYTTRQGQIDEICYVNLERDIKKATIIPISNRKSISRIITKATDFIFQTTDIKDLTVIVSQGDKSSQRELENSKYINLGNEDTNTVYYIEQELIHDMPTAIFQRS